LAGTIVIDRIESDASYASTINVAGQITFSNTVNFGAYSGTAPVAGFYLPTTNNLAFTTASTERMRINNNGDVGIGTASPSTYSKLTVFGSSVSGFAGITSINGAGSSGSGGIQFGSDGTYVKSAIALVREQANGGGSLVFYNDSNADAANWATTDEKMRIDFAGNVGIGTSSPAKKLELYSSQNANVELLRLNNPDVNGLGTQIGFTQGSTTWSQIISEYSSSWRMKIGAGSTNAFTAGDAGYITFFTNNGSSSYAERMRLDSNGFLGIGSTSPGAGEKLSVNSTGQYVCWMNQQTNTSGFHVLRLGLNPNNNNTSSYFLHGNTNTVGNWFLYGNGTMSFSSDQRLKKNIETTRDGYVEDLCRLRVVKYNWRNDDNSTPKELGLIAQEVAEVFPNLVLDDQVGVTEDDSTHYKSLKYSVLPFMLLKAIQEQQALITTLTARITALESK
jgi:hypothetical protein